MLKSYSFLVCLVSIVFVSLWVSPAVGTDRSADADYKFNATTPINNVSVVLHPFSNAPQLVSWAFGSETINATYIEVNSAIIVNGNQEYQNSKSRLTFNSNHTGPQIVSNSQTKDPCEIYVANNQSVSFVISEALTDAPSGMLAQYLDIQPLPIIQTNSSTTVPILPSCNNFGSDDKFEFCSANAYFGLNATSATNNRTIIIKISLSDNAKLTDKLNQVILAGEGSCPNGDNTDANRFVFPLTQVNGSEATFQANVEPKLNGLWYLFLDYSLPIRETDATVTVSLVVNPQYQPPPPHHGSDDSDSGSMDDDDGSGSDDHHGRKIAGIIVAIVIGLLILAAVAVYVIRKRRAHFDQLE
eukprot:TRINITY_DN16382_c0_g1_i1.p1 TRINITY_DN16382_c0_g1~~TRINITY_DN16382_c0_g1_i1.p1  ORF type:complete len:357 (+),score=83.38 TRINITY_DN16382_c0_g1_i1:471-1541(+)